MEINFENALIEAHDDWQHSELEMLAWRTSLLGGKESSLSFIFFRIHRVHYNYYYIFNIIFNIVIMLNIIITFFVL